MFLSIIYPVIGLVLARLTLSYDLLPLLFPLAAGFALIGPFGAIGLDELSRQRELGLEVSRKDAFGARRCPAIDGSLLRCAATLGAHSSGSGTAAVRS